MRHECVGKGVAVGTHLLAAVEQHAEEAAFLWLLRDAAVGAPHYTLAELAALDARLEAHLDGLRVAGDQGWRVSEEALRTGEPGEVFVAGILALERGDGEALAAIARTAAETRAATRGFASALGWVAPDCAARWMHAMLRAQSSTYRRPGIAALALHRVDPGDALPSLLRDPDPATRRRALRSVGELKRLDLRDSLADCGGDDAESRLWASWSGLLLGERSALEPLRAMIAMGASASIERPALQLVLRVLDPQSARRCLKALAQEPAHRRAGIIGCGVAGDAFYLPWLIEQMRFPQHARVAGEAFSMITGVDLGYEDLEGECPDGFEAGPSESADDEDVDLDPDIDLPWPHVELIKAWWGKHGPQFQQGVRALCGMPITVEHCRHVLRRGFQRQRIAAAFELALLNPEEPLFEWRAPGFRQQNLLGMRPSVGGAA